MEMGVGWGKETITFSEKKDYSHWQELKELCVLGMYDYHM